MKTPTNKATLVPSGPVGPGVAPPTGSSPLRRPGPTGPAGDEMPRARVWPLHFSNHALQRVETRSIDVGGATLERLNSGVSRAAAKGARDAVILVDGTAFVVSVRNRTVVTAVDRGHMRGQVFTNIDSAVIA